MASSPQFVGYPRSGLHTFVDGLSHNQHVFLAGDNGSLIRSILAQGYGDTQLYATVKIRTDTYDLHLGVFTLTMTGATGVTNLLYNRPDEILVDDTVPYVQREGGARYLELAPGESITISVHDGAGNGPGVGEGAEVRVLGMDY